MNSSLHLPDRWRPMVEKLLQTHVPDVEVWAYGSRVNGTHHEGSDLDLVLRARGLREIPILQLGNLREGLDESNIPIIVDVHDWATLPDSFRAEIEREYVVFRVPTAGERPG